jgi:DNA-binding PadR family transcriptional regulator
MEINLRTKKRRPTEKWLAIANEFNSGKSPEEIVAMPQFARKDGKRHNRGYVYWVIKQLEKEGLITVKHED